jgi:hypothetical protein
LAGELEQLAAGLALQHPSKRSGEQDEDALQQQRGWRCWLGRRWAEVEPIVAGQQPFQLAARDGGDLRGVQTGVEGAAYGDGCRGGGGAMVP